MRKVILNLRDQQLDKIVFPFFGLKYKPFKIVYSIDKIKILSNKEYLETVDDKTFKGNYFERLLQLPYRVNFDYTCTGIQHIIFNKVRWGLDSNAKPYDLTSITNNKKVFKKVEKISDSLVWVKGISYPFELEIPDDIHIEDEVFAKLILVGTEWYIEEFTYQLDKGII